MVGDDPFQPREQNACKAVARVGLLRAVGIDKGDDAGGMAHQRARGHIGHIMELLDGVENPLHRLRGNAVVIAVNDIGNRRQADADKVGDILHRGHR